MSRLLICAACCLLLVAVVSGCGSEDITNGVTTSSSLQPLTTLPAAAATTVAATQVPTTETPSTTTTQPPWGDDLWLNVDALEAIAVVEDFYAALNAGDTAVIADLQPEELRKLMTRILPIAVEGAGARFEVRCSPADGPTDIVCEETVWDDLYGPALIVHHQSVRYRVRDDGGLTVKRYPSPFICSGDPQGSAQRFLLDFHEWSVATHPETEQHWMWGIDNTALSIPCTPYPFHAADGAAEICSQLEEFLAESEKWPPAAIAAWEELATRIELLAGDALVQAELIDTVVDELSNEALSEAGWFESCCAEPREELATILSEISKELETADELLPDLGGRRAPEAMEYLQNAKEGIAHALGLLESGIEWTGQGQYPSSARSMIGDGLPTIIQSTIAGCVRACVVG